LLDPAGAVVDSVTYSTGYPWVGVGDGPSLERLDAAAPSTLASNWVRGPVGGSPAAANVSGLAEIKFGAIAANPEGASGTSNTVLGDDIPEAPFFWGEWILVSSAQPAGATVSQSGFFGLGVVVIFDDD